MAENTAEDIFLPEKVVDSGFGQQDGKRYYKIKWVRYTWEAEDAVLHLKELLDNFWSEHGGMPDSKDKIEDETNNTTVVESIKEDLKDDEPNSSNDSQHEPHQTIEQSVEQQKSLITVLLKAQDEVVVVEPAKVPITDISTLQAVTALQTITTAFADESGKAVKFSGLEKLSCDVCLRTYSSSQSLRAHKRSVHKNNEKQYQCETCLKMFAEKSTLRRHMYIHLEEKPFKCEHCDKGFSDKSTLRRHLVTHTGIKRFQCSCCDKRFTRNEHLRQHMFIHTAEKIYKCDVCLKDFRQRSTLKNHMLLHRADSAIKCNVCGALFGKQVQLEKHLIWCNGVTSSYKCDECDRCFQERGGLKRHMLLHSGERPYKCDYCDQTFNDRSILRRHIFKHTERKPFECAVCNKEFLRKATLQSHVTREHCDEVNRSVFGLVHTYDMTDGIPLNDSTLDQQVQLIIQPEEPEVEGAINQVEVTTNDVSQGVSVVAQAVRNITDNAILTVVENKQVSNNQEEQINDSRPPKLHVGQGLEPGENQLIQVQILQMDDGNQIVQSIHALTPCESVDKHFAVENQTSSIEKAQAESNNASEIDEKNSVVQYHSTSDEEIENLVTKEVHSNELQDFTETVNVQESHEDIRDELVVEEHPVLASNDTADRN